MHKFFVFITLLSVMQMVGLSAAASNETVIAIVVASNQDGESIKLSEGNLNLIYWRKQRYWPKGLPIKPVNLSPEHPLRITFSKSVLGSRPQAQTVYWNEQYFNGVLPPYSVDSEEAAIRYISKTQGAIGYVDACLIDARIKPILWVENGKLTRIAPSLPCH